MHIPYGNNLKLYIEGESRGEYLTALLYNFPSGFKIDAAALNDFMQKRSPGKNSYSSARKESDIPEFITGVFDFTTVSNPIEIRIKNTDAKPTDTDYTDTPRPSHADYPAAVKYGPECDLRGGGHFSGRLTAPLCAAGGICLQYLKSLGIEVFAHIYEIGGVSDKKYDPMNPHRTELSECGLYVEDNSCGLEMLKRMEEVKAQNDSCGGIIECAVTGLNPGLGEHLFAGIEGRISSILFSVPSVKSVEFGDGAELCFKKGSEVNDGYITDGKKVTTLSNHSGGIAGGMTTGMPLIVRAGLKPIPSISLPQKTVSLRTMTNTEITLRGRNDCCAVPRAVAVIEAAVAIAVVDILLDLPAVSGRMNELRRDIDICDRNIISAYNQRMSAVKQIGQIKAKNNADVYVKSREEVVLKRAATLSDTEFSDETVKLYSSILEISKEYQKNTHTCIRGFENKKIYLIGNPLGHSVSPEIHSHISDYSYELKPLCESELAEFFEKREFDGLNITIPYKKSVVKYLDSLSNEAIATGAVNTVVKLSDGSLRGYNTDVYGFGYMFDTLNKGTVAADTRVFIAGNGGAAAAVKYALKSRGFCDIVTVTRKDEGTIRPDEIPLFIENKNYILINATPVGMYPDCNGCIFDNNIIINASAVFDLVYNPFRTELCQKAQKAGVPVVCGFTMLVAQALSAAKIFTGNNFNADVSETVAKLRQSVVTPVLIGMPGCGKTTVGKALADALGFDFFDTDEEIEKLSGKSCKSIIIDSGLDTFRSLEHQVLTKITDFRKTVISTGGGAVTREDNCQIIRSAGPVIWLKKPLYMLDTSNRPLSGDGNLENLYNSRKDLYKSTSDIEIDADTDVKTTVNRIIKQLTEYYGGIVL